MLCVQTQLRQHYLFPSKDIVQLPKMSLHISVLKTKISVDIGTVPLTLSWQVKNLTINWINKDMFTKNSF